MTLIGFLADYVEGKFNTDTDKMICVPHDKYQRVDLCMRTTGMHLPFAEIKLFVRDRYADAKEMYADAVALGEEIVRRWNAGPAVQGMWITMKGASLSHCSVCKESVLEHLKTRRCPSCDALMFEPQAQEKEPAVVSTDTHERNCGNCEGTECATGKCINWSCWTPLKKPAEPKQPQDQGGDDKVLPSCNGEIFFYMQKVFSKVTEDAYLANTPISLVNRVVKVITTLHRTIHDLRARLAVAESNVAKMTDALATGKQITLVTEEYAAVVKERDDLRARLAAYESKEQGGDDLIGCSAATEAMLRNEIHRQCDLNMELTAQARRDAVRADKNAAECSDLRARLAAYESKEQGGDEPALYHHDGIPHLINAEQKVSALTKDIDNLRARCKRYEKQMEAAGIKHDPFDGTIF